MKLIAGPCSAESYEQVLATAQFLSQATTCKYFRAGCWKPRSRPGSFEGVGKLGLEWLKKVEEQFSLAAMTEVSSAQHLEGLLESGLTHFWIGARTTTNPFLIDEISEVIRGHEEKLHVFIKNPLAPDLNLWVGAIERFQQKSKELQVSAIHRGFGTYFKSGMRNTPIWDLPLQLKEYFNSKVDVYCDPSHIAGERRYISNISQVALRLGLDGLMLEVHPKPSLALSDKKQQLSFQEITLTLENLEGWGSCQQTSKLCDSRERIDNVDLEILRLLAKRKDIVSEIKSLKSHSKQLVYSPERFNEKLEICKKVAKELGLLESDAELLYRLLHGLSLEWQS